MASSQKLGGGFIKLIIGPMFSGKTNELISEIRRLKISNKTCLIINHKSDDRYEKTKDKIVSHDLNSIGAQQVARLSDLKDQYKQYHAIAIDEGQFFPDIQTRAQLFANYGLKVFISALDADFQRKPFQNIVNLIPKAEYVKQLNAICMDCGKDASFSQRKSMNKETILIGGLDLYKPVCRDCFFTQGQ